MLNIDEQKSLHILGYLYYRMSLYEKAEKILKSLLVMTENNPYDKSIFALTASLAIMQKNGAQALEYLQNLFDGSVFVGRQACYYLLKAQALYLEGRRDEAKDTLDKYLLLKGN